MSVELPDSTLIEYVIDGQNRRIGKRVDGILTKAWLYKDQLKPIAEMDGSGNLTARFVYGSKSNVPDVLMKYNAGLVTTYRVISDHLGSPIMAVNVSNSSDVPFRAEYSAFGERTVTSGAASEDWMPFGFAGGLYDLGTGLTRFGARDYDPVTGTWTRKEPKRFDAIGTNFYSYALGNPINLGDKDGRDVCQFTSTQGFHHQWIEIGGDSGRSYGFYPAGSPLFGPGKLSNPDPMVTEGYAGPESGTGAICMASSAAEDAGLEEWIDETYDVNKASYNPPYSLGMSDCRAFTQEAMEQLARIQGDPWQLAKDLIWGVW